MRGRSRAAHGAFYSTISLPGLVYKTLAGKGLRSLPAAGLAVALPLGHAALERTSRVHRITPCYGTTPSLPLHSKGKAGFGQVSGLSTERT